MMESVESVKNKILKGDYSRKNKNGKGRYRRIMDVVYDEKNDIEVKGFFVCRVCAQVIFNGNLAGGTSQLNRHANNCDPLENDVHNNQSGKRKAPKDSAPSSGKLHTHRMTEML